MVRTREPVGWIYFVAMIILGSFFAVNLALAVLFVSFVNGRKDDEEANPRDRERAAEAKKSVVESEDQYQAAKLEEVERMIAEHARSPRSGGDKNSRAFSDPPNSTATPSGVGLESAEFGSASVAPLPPGAEGGGEASSFSRGTWRRRGVAERRTQRSNRTLSPPIPPGRRRGSRTFALGSGRGAGTWRTSPSWTVG